MHKTTFTHRLIAALLTAILLTQPIFTSPILDWFLGERVAYAMPMTRVEEDFSVFLPLIASGSETTGQGDPTPTPTSEPTAGSPQFIINSPVADSTIGGMTFFSIQPEDADSIESVTFRAGSTDLGSDNDGSDGFKVFLNAKDLAAGETQLTVTASGPGGESTETINVTVVPDPPQSATIGEEGGVLASEIGSVISLLPGSVPEGTTVTVDELTLEETTERHGIDWEAMGVTFLGAQDVQSSAPIEGPFGMVASAGFGNRVQPGQAVVNYRIAPDADGDGVDEIVVVNTASVAPNGDVVADPLAQVSFDTVGQNIVSHMPGQQVEVWAVGLNSVSPRGNLAIWTSLENQQEVVVPAVPQVLTIASKPSGTPQDAQLFMTVVPLLPQGKATLLLRNDVTKIDSPLIEVEIGEASELATSASNIINQFLVDAAIQIEATMASVDINDPVYTQVIEHQIATLIDELTRLRYLFAVAFEEVEQLPATDRETAQQALDFFALILQEQGQGVSAQSVVEECLEDIFDDLSFALGVGAAVVGIAAMFTPLAPVALVLNATSWGMTGASIGIGAALRRQAVGELGHQCKPPPNCSPSRNGPNGPTGMGAAPPPGGNGCGGGSGGGGGNARSGTAYSQADESYAVKIFSNNSLTPFTGLTDSSGYFFVPFIPAGEPFTAVAIDTTTGDTRDFSGVGPETSDSVFMFFDFFSEQEFMPSIQWDGGGDGSSWHDPLNWDTDQVPNNSDRVLIDVEDDPIIRFREGATTLVSLQSSENMEFTGGQLTVNAKSSISGALTLTGGFQLNVDGRGASLTASGSTLAVGTNLFAINGGKIMLPSLTRYEGEGIRNTIHAEGSSSLIDLSSVTIFKGNAGGFFGSGGLTVEAHEGGKINLSNVQSVNTGIVKFTADGNGSTIDLASLTLLHRGEGDGESLLQPLNDGKILADQLTDLQSVNLNLDGTGTLATNQITTFTGGKVEAKGFTPDLSNVTNINGSSFTVADGGKLSFPMVTSYTGDGPGSDFSTTFHVEGAGSQLDLSTITEFGGNAFVNDALKIEILSGGKIDLSNVEKIDIGKIQFSAEGGGSIIDLSALTSFIRGGRGESSLKSTFNGSILIEQLTELQGVTLMLDGTGTLATSQITIFTGGKIEASGVAPDFANITDLDGVSIAVTDGATVSFPKVVSYAGDGEGSSFFTSLHVSGIGSLLDLSTITSLEGNTFVNDDLEIKAVSGGKIDLSQVTEITVGMVQFTADGQGSVIDLSLLTRFIRSGRGTSSMEALNNGTIQAELLTEVTDVEITAETGTILMP